MKKQLACCTAALLLTACGTDIEQKSSMPERGTEKSAVAAVTPMTDTSEVPDIYESTPDEPAVTPDSASSAADSKTDDKKALRKKLRKEITLDYPKTVEQFAEIKLSDAVTTNAKLTAPDTLLETDKAGEHEQKIELEYEGEKFSFTLKFTAADTQPPVCLLDGSGNTILTGSDFDLNSLVSYADYCDPEPTLSYAGFVDTSAAGVYPITVTVIDHSGNYISWDLDINVSDSKPEPYVDAGDQIEFSDFMQMYAGADRSFGIDVSRWQGDIDFEKVRDAGCEFVIMRMGFSSDGTVTTDECYDYNIQAARAAGLKVGIYVYSEDTDPADAFGVGKWVAAKLGGTAVDMPIAFDWEDFYNFQNYKLSIHDMEMVLDSFAAGLRESGYSTMLYSSKNFLERFWVNRDKYPVWCAAYLSSDTYDGAHILWQRCGNGIIDGINGAVDLNIWYK